jgi:hypothetical protein
MVEVCGQDDGLPCLYFGFRPDSQKVTIIPGNVEGQTPGFRSIVWTFPRLSDRNTKATRIDNLFVYRFDYLDRLEAGARMATPFDNIRDIDHARILVMATEHLARNISSINIIVNDFVISELGAKDIAGWAFPTPTMPVQMVRGRIDPATGQMVQREVKSLPPINLNTFNLDDEMKSYSMLTANISSARVASSVAPMWATLDFANMEVRALRASSAGLGPRAAGNASMTILPGEHGWLPKEVGA